MSGREIYPISKVDSNDTKLEINCRVVNPILFYFGEQYGRKELERFTCATKMNLDYLEDSNNWVSYDYFCRLLAKLVEYTGDPQAPFTAGTYTTQRKCYGSIERFFSRLGTPGATYKLIAKYAHTCTKLTKWEVSNSKKNSCIIRICFPSDSKQDKNNCLNLQGLLASIPLVWDLPLAKVEELQCAVDGGNACVYKISWRNRPTHMFGLFGLLAGVVLLLAAKILLETNPSTFMLISIPILGYFLGRMIDYRIALRDSVSISEKESKDVLESVETIEKLNVELEDKVERRTEELKKALKDLGESQDQLVQSEKMASVGRLAGGMAHELNNPVAAVRSYIQDILEDTPSEDPRRDRLQQAEKATARCRRIVRDLLTFAREEKDLQRVNMNDIIQAVILNAKKERANSKTTMSEELAPDLPAIRIDPLQIQQMLDNLIINACDAVGDEGEIIVRTSCEEGNISIVVSDNGEGIPQDIQDKIFDPFFTTKPPGKGTGLGLAISYNIIKRFNGDIRVESEKGSGATFAVILPLEAGNGPT